MKERAFVVLTIIIIALVGLKACSDSIEELGSQVIVEQYEYLREPTAPVDAFTEYRSALLASDKQGSGFLFYVLIVVLILVVLAGCWFVFANGFEKIAKQSKSLKRTFEPARQLQPVRKAPQLLPPNSWLDDE